MAETANDLSNAPRSFLQVSVDELVGVTEAFLQEAGVAASLRVRKRDRPSRVEMFLGTAIGFVGDQVRGTLTVAPPLHLLQASHPTAAGRELAPAERADWLGEMSNQILGRCKNRLAAYGVSLMCDVPLTMCGAMRVGGRGRVLTALEWNCREEPLRMWWDLQVDPSMVVSKTVEGAAAPEEGELCLF